MSKFISFIDENASLIFSIDEIRSVRYSYDSSMISILFKETEGYTHFFFKNVERARLVYESIKRQLCE